MASEDPPRAGTVDSGRCPICSAPTERNYRPFCSGRCRDVDLLRWLRGAYAIPGGQADADEDGEDTTVKRASYLHEDEDEDAAE